MFEIGVDIESVERFSNKTLENDDIFLKSIFTDNELEYCFKNGKIAQHLCGKFCAKEAFIKAISDYNLKINFNQIEVLNKTNGKPYFNLPKVCNKLACKLSISHTNTYAVAYVFIDNLKKEDGDMY